MKRSPGQMIFDGFNYIFITAVIVLSVYPLLYVAFASFSRPERITSHQGLLWKSLGFSTDAYGMVLENPMVILGYRNVLFILAAGTLLNVVLTCICGYVLSRKDLYWRNFLMFTAVFTMFFSGGMIPFYIQVQKLGLMDSLWALILPTAISTYNVIIMRTAFLAIPGSMEESARLDGANDFTILFRIMIPLALPTVAVMVLFYGVGHWNAWFNAMLFIRKRELYPLQLVLREIIVLSSTDNMVTDISGTDRMPVGETIKYATIIVTTVPILLIYPFLQKYFVKGVMIGAIKE